MFPNTNVNHLKMSPPNKKQKTSHIKVPSIDHIKMQTTPNTMSFIMQDTKISISNIKRHFNTISDEELCRQVASIKTKMNRTISLLKKQSAEAMDLMEVANARYLYTKQQLKEERERANHFQGKVDNLQKKLIENHNMLFKMFDEQ